MCHRKDAEKDECQNEDDEFHVYCAFRVRVGPLRPMCDATGTIWGTRRLLSLPCDTRVPHTTT